MNIWESITGTAELSLTGAEVYATAQRIAEQGISLLDMTTEDALTVRFRIARRDLPRVRQICQKRGDKITVRANSGLFWLVSGLVHRWVLLSGILLLYGLTVFLPTRILFVSVEGNRAVPSGRILAAARDCGLDFGTRRKEVRSEKFKNALLSALPELQWAGVNTSGCTATISVRERAEDPKEEVTGGFANILACRDGVITSATALRGSLLCREGQAVQKGEILISGYVDCGLCIRTVRAEGEVYADTVRSAAAIVPATYRKRTGEARTERYYSLLIGKKRINFVKYSGIRDSTCGRIYEENYVTLPGGFQLPIALVKETVTEYPLQEAEFDHAAAEEMLRKCAEDGLCRQMIAGSIQEKQESITLEDGFYLLTAQYYCREMIGRAHPEEIGE